MVAGLQAVAAGAVAGAGSAAALAALAEGAPEAVVEGRVGNRELQVASSKFKVQSSKLGEGMKTIWRATALAALIVVATGASSGCSYNRFVSEEEALKAQWAQVENQLQRRNDLIPNLVETTKGFAQQERDVFQAIADSRAKLAGAQTTEQKIQAANEQSAALSRLLVVVENYPVLKSNETFARLMDELSGTENRIATERMRYNERVQQYNTSRRSFPANITASIFGFGEYPLSRCPNRPRWHPKWTSRARRRRQLRRSRSKNQGQHGIDGVDSPTDRTAHPLDV